MSRAKGVSRAGADLDKALAALKRARRAQPPELTRRFGILNLFWVAVEELGAARGPRALEALVADGYVRRHPRHPGVGRLTSAGLQALGREEARAA